MKKVLKIVSISLVLIILLGSTGYLFYKNIKLNKSYEAATKQVTQLQAKLDAVGTFTDVYTVKTSVKMGQEIKEEDLTLQTVPTSSVPTNIITDKSELIGNYYRIGFEPGTPITRDLVNIETYIGSVYSRDVFLDTLPVGTQVGDYVDIRVVLPGGEEFVVFEHRRVNARYENAIKMKFDEADLWLYTSMMVDKALYNSVGFKVYATKYVDPGAHDKTVAYYPVRKEVTDIMNISMNLTQDQKNRMYNENLRASIDAKLDYYNNPLNKDSSLIANGWKDEESRFNAATQYYESLMEELNNGSSEGSGLVDPTDDNGSTSNGENIGNLNNGGSEGNSTTDESQGTASSDGLKDPQGNGSVVDNDDIVDSSGDNLFDDENPIE